MARIWMMNRNILAILFLEFSTTSLNCFHAIKFANSAILKFIIALGWAAFCSLFCLCYVKARVSHLKSIFVIALSLKYFCCLQMIIVLYVNNQHQAKQLYLENTIKKAFSVSYKMKMTKALHFFHNFLRFYAKFQFDVI